MARYPRMNEGDDGWTEWIRPTPQNKYQMACCDCGLVHTLQFMVDHGEAVFRAKRNNRSTALVRRHMKGKQ